MLKSEILENYLATLKIDSVILNQYHQVPPTWQDYDVCENYCKIYLICDGEGWLKINNKEYYPKPGQIIFLPDNTDHSYSFINANRYTKYWSHFTATLCGVNISKVIHFNYMIDIGNDTFCRDTFEKLLTLSKSSSFTAKLAQKVKVMELLSYFFGHQKIDEISLNNTKQIDSMRKILKYIDTNYINNVTIDELAEHVFMHPNYFFRFFKKNTGETPIHYINNKRINKAKYILSTTKYTVDEVSKMVGFHDSSYFYRVFKKWVGITPIEYRLINKEEQ